MDKLTKPLDRMGSAARLALPILLSLVLLVQCAPGDSTQKPDREVYTFTGATMGTTYTLKVVSHDLSAERQHAIQAAVDEALEAVNATMSTYQKDSELSQFNQWMKTEPFEISADLMDVLTRAQTISEQSGGAFDVTVGRLVDLWGFGPSEEFRERELEPMEVERARKQMGYRKLHLDTQAGTLQKDIPMIYVDLSAIAKGYGVDYAAQALEKLGYTEYMLEVGGEVRTRGRNGDGQWWRIAIEEPVPGIRQPHRVVPLDDMAMATSGEYRNFYERDGVRLSHTIDPTTGRPITHMLASASVLHEECTMADGYATAMMVLGPEKGLALAEKLDLPVFFIVHDGDGGFADIASPAFKRYVEAHAPE